MNGSEAYKLLAYGEEYDGALERIVSEAPDIWAQVYHTFREEWALTADDIVYRGTTLGLRGLDTPQIQRGISAIVESGSEPLGLHRSPADPRPNPAVQLSNLLGASQT